MFIVAAPTTLKLVEDAVVLVQGAQLGAQVVVDLGVGGGLEG